MLLILLSWLYIVFTSINLGVSFEKTIKLKQDDSVITAVLGLFASTIIGSIWAIFGRINIEFHIFLLALNGILFYYNKRRHLEIKTIFIKNIQQLSLFLKFFLGINCLLILAQCASLPYLVDNESYYIQTIKWINEYGFVKGLANLHIFYGQTSGWHITQSIFNFSFIYPNFNDISGFCLVLGNVFSVQKLNVYLSNQKKNYLIIGLLPIANVLLFQFISAPSPDIPVYIFSFIVFYYFLEDFKKGGKIGLYCSTILSIYIVYCKPTAICILLLPLAYFSNNFKELKKQLIPLTATATLVFVLFLIKNTLITGYPLYPSTLLSYNSLDYAIPKEVMAFYFDKSGLYGFMMSKSQFMSMSYLQIFIKWLTLNKIDAVFNIVSCLLILTSPYYIKRYHNLKAIWILYSVMVAQLILLLASSPQYRFFIHFILIFSFFTLSCFIKNKKLINLILLSSLIATAVICLFTINFNSITNNKLLTQNSSFSNLSFIFPAKNSKLETNYFQLKEGNLKYYTPDSKTYFWLSGNGNLPSVNSKQLNYFKIYFHYLPQLRNKSLKDGFYNKKIQE